MKRVLLPILVLFSLSGISQTTGGVFNASKAQAFNKSAAANGAHPLDYKAMYHDTIHFVDRPFTSIAEANSFLPSVQRLVGLQVYINTGGTVNGTTGVLTGGTNQWYYYKNGVTNGDLVPLAGGSLTFPNTQYNYVNGYGNFQALDADSVFEGSSHRFYYDSYARAAFSLTTTGTGAASYNSSTGVFNIPTPSGGSGALNSKAVGFGNGSNVLTGDSSKIKFNSANSSLFINLNNTRPVADGTKVIHWFGDSITAGFITTTTDQRTSSLVTKALGYTEDNQGYSGGTLMKRVPVDPFGTANMVDRISSIPVHSSGDKYIIFWLGTNDIRVPSTYWNTTYSVANFVADYSTILDSTIIARGHPADSVVILSPAHLVPESFLVGDSAAGRLRQLSIDSACQVVATIKGCRYFNTDSLMKTVGSDAINLLNPDFVHPNQGGHAMLAAGIAHFLSSIGMDSQEPQQLAVGGLSEFQNVRYRNPRFIPRWSRPLGVDSSGNIGITRQIYLPGNIYARGSTASDGPENGIFPTGIRSGGLRITDIPPPVSTGSMLELLYDPANVYAGINAYNKAGGAGIPLYLNYNGGKITYGSAYGGFTDKHNFSGSAGFNDGLIIRGSNPAAGPGLSMSYFGSFCTVDALSGILGLNGNGGGLVTVGAYADNGTGAKFQVAGASSFRLSGGSGSAVDYPITVSALSSFSPIAGYGVGQKFEAHNSASTLKIVGTTDFAYTTTTASSESADWILKTIRAGTLTEAFRIKSTGVINIPALAGGGTQGLAVDNSGNVITGSSGGNTNSNVGSAFRLAKPGTNDIKTVSAGPWFVWDSATTNQLRGSVDTTTAVARMRQIANDSLNSLRGTLESSIVKEITTTNATPVNVDTIVIAPGEMVTVEVQLNGVKDNGHAAVVAKKKRSFLLDDASTLRNGTLISSEPETYIPSAAGLSTASFSITNTGDLAIIQFTGEASTTILAKFTYTITRKGAPL